MELIIITFIVGIAVGTISGPLFVKLSEHKAPPKTNPDSGRARPIASASIRRPSRPHTVKSRTSHRSRVRIAARPSEPELAIPETRLIAQSVVSLCPACGLQAPEHLMAEHFLGSPSHQSGPSLEATLVESKVEQVQGSGDEDSANSVRHLLQILVPPRAFGRRHAQRTVNPLSRLVQTLEETRSELVQPF